MINYQRPMTLFLIYVKSKSFMNKHPQHTVLNNKIAKQTLHVDHITLRSMNKCKVPIYVYEYFK